MSWLIQRTPLLLISPSESNDDEEDVEDISDDDIVSESQSECSKEYDDDDFDNKSLEIDEEERHKISAQINPDDEDEEDDDTEEEEKEEIIEKEDSGQEKNQDEHEDQASAASHSSVCNDSSDDDQYQGRTNPAGQDDEELSMTESAESRTLDTYGHIQKLELERKQLLQELDADEKHRIYFYNKLKTITQKMESLQHTENSWMQNDIARRQLEMEAYRIQEALHEKLGQQEESKQRQEAKLDRVKNIEMEIMSLQMQANKSLKRGKDAPTPPVLERDGCRIKLDQENGVGGSAFERTETNSGQLTAVSKQKGEVSSVTSLAGIAPGIPLSSNHFGTHSDTWPFWRGHSSLFNSLATSQDLTSVSFNSTTSSLDAKQGTSLSSPSSLVPGTEAQSQHLGTKVEMVYSLLSMLGTHDKEDMSRTLFSMSQSQDNCVAMRQAGCLPLLLQLLHGNDKDSGLLGKTRGSKTDRARASAVLHNIVHCHHDDKRSRREARTLRLLEQIRAHCDQQRGDDEPDDEAVDSNHTEMDHHPGAAIAALMKLSFDEDYRHAICTLGGLQAIAELLEIDNRSITPMNDYSTTIRRYSCMTLTNLTFGDGKNKALLCSMRSAMQALTDQLRSTNEDLIQAAASVLRNLSWRADLASKKVLREISVVTTLMKASMSVKKETTLKSILSALWNLSSHCSENKAEICAVEGALQFLVSLLTYKSTAKTLAIIENGGGILRNVSSHIAIREDYRQILRKHDCLKILLFHLKSPSLTIVSNACGTLWNLSARCEEDQNALREMGAVSMLRNLVHSRHKMISSGSSAALKNLLSSVPAGKSVDSDRLTGSPRPSLHVRKQRALEAEIDHNLSETCENVESPRNSPTEIVHRSESEPRRFVYHLGGSGGHRQEEDTRKHMTRRQMMPRIGMENGNNFDMPSSGRVPRAGSQDSVGSTHSDISHDRTRSHTMLAKSSILLQKRQSNSLERKDQQIGAYNSMPPTNHSHNLVFDYKRQQDENIFGNGTLTAVNDIPAHRSQSSSGNQHYQQHWQNQGWQTMPNNRITHHKHEAVDLSSGFHGTSSLTQSAPSHCQAFHPVDVVNNQHQQSLLQRLAKSSSGLSGSCNLNNSITVANSGISNIDHGNCLTLCSTADKETNQPVNYSLKYQDGSSFDRSNKSPACINMHLSYDQLTLTNKASDYTSGTLDDNLRLSVTNASMNEHICPKNNLINPEKVQANNRQAADVSGSNTVLNSNVLNCHRPLPNLVYNHFHTPQGHQSSEVSHHQSQFATSQDSHDLSSVGYHYLAYTEQASNKSFPLFSAAEGSRLASQGKIFNKGSDQFNTVQMAHQNVLHMHPSQQFSRSTKTELGCIIDKSTDSSLYCSEVSDLCSKNCQEQPINYSVRFHDSRKEDQIMESYNGDKHFMQSRRTEIKNIDACSYVKSNDNLIQTFGTERSQYQTSTSLTGLTPTGKQERGRNINKMEDNNCENNMKTVTTTASSEMVTGFEEVGSRSELDICLSDSQNTDRKIGSKSIAARDHDKRALDQTEIYFEEDIARSSSTASSIHRSETRDSDAQLKLSSCTEKVEEETALTSSRSSSSDSLSSCKNQPINCSVINKHSQRASDLVLSGEILDRSSESVHSNPEQTNSLTRRFKDFLVPPKYRNTVNKQPVNFDKTPNTIKSESFASFAAFDEEGKPINFAMKSQELSLAHSFPRFDVAQAVDFSSFGRDQEQPQLTFSTFQKNFQLPMSNQSSHFTNRLCTPRAKTLPTLIEQTAETDSTSGGSEVPEKTVTPSLLEVSNVINMAVSSKEDDFHPSHPQQQTEKSNLPKKEVTEYGPVIFQLEPFAETCESNSMSSKKISPMIGQQKQEDWDSSMSEASETDDNILSQNIICGTSVDMKDKSLPGSTSKRKSGIPMKMSPGLQPGVLSKAFSIPKHSPKQTASLIKSQSVNAKNTYIDESEDYVQMVESNMPKNQYERHIGSSCDAHIIDDGYQTNSDSKMSTFTNKISNLATVVPYIPTDTVDVEGSLLSSTNVSGIPKSGKSLGCQRNDVTNINQNQTKLYMQTQMRHSLLTKSKSDAMKSVIHKSPDNMNVDSDSSANETLDYGTSPHPVCMSDDVTVSTSDDSISDDEKEKENMGDVMNDISLKYQKQAQIYENDMLLSAAKEKQNIGQPSESFIAAGDKIDRLKFDIDDIPYCISRNSSLNSFNGIYRIDLLETLSNDTHEKSAEPSSNDEASDSSATDVPAETSALDVLCNVKYCPSYDSLSEELVYDDSTSPEQTLQEQCTYSCMPKSRLPRSPDTASKYIPTSTTSPRELLETENYYTIGLIKSASLDMTNGYHSGSETDHGSQSSLSQNQSSSENCLTHSCSDSKELDLHFQIPPFLSWQSRCSTWCHQRQQYHVDDESTDNDNVNESFNGDISPEETERLLTENVNLIMSVIQTTKMSGSSVDEDLFIENETISLVSNDYASDTNSEVSITWSVASDKTTDLSSATLAGNKNQAQSLIRRGGPKLVKPTTAQLLVKKAVPESDRVVSVRGRRKPLYPGRLNNAAIAIRGNIKTVAINGTKASNIQTGNKIVVQSGTTRSDVGRVISRLKKTPPKNANVTQVSPKTVPIQCNDPKNKIPPQKMVVRRSRSAGPVTTVGKNRASMSALAGTNRIGSRGMTPTQSAPQASRSNLVKTVFKIGGGFGGKFSSPTGSSVTPQGIRSSPDQSRLSAGACIPPGSSPDQARLSAGASIPPGQSRIPTSTSTPTGQSRLPNANSSSKNNSNITAINNKKNNKFGGQTTRSASSNTLSSISTEKKAGQNSSKILHGGSANTTASNKCSESGIPRRKSGGSTSSFSNSDFSKQNPHSSLGSNKHTSPVNTDLSKCTSSNNLDFNKCSPSGNANTNKRTSSSNTDVTKRTSPNSTDSNKRTASNNTDSSKRISSNSIDPSKRTPPSNTDPSKCNSPNHTDPSKRASPKTTDSSKRASPKTIDPNKRASPKTTDPNKRTSPNNTDPNKRTPAGVMERRQPSSRIATLWKKGGNLDRSPLQGSQLTSTPSSSTKLPVSVTKSSPANTSPRKLPHPGFKAKAATLPNSSLASSKSRSFSERISKSSTYEKISSELQVHDTKAIIRDVKTTKMTVESAKQKRDNFSSSKFEVRHDDVFDSSDDDENNDTSVKVNISQSEANAETSSSDDPNDSFENTFDDDSSLHQNVKVTLNSTSDIVDSLEQTEDTDTHIDSSTFRKKKRDPYISDLDLPNADETCRSTYSFSDFLGTPQINSFSGVNYKSSLNVDCIIRKMSIIDILEKEMIESINKKSPHEEERSGSKSKSTVAQGLKKLFSGKQKDKEKELKEKNASKESSKSRHHEKESKAKHYKSNSKDKRSGKDKREYDFFRTNIKIEPSTTWTVEDSLEDDLEANTVFPIIQIPLRPTTFNLAAATDVNNQPPVSVRVDEHHDEMNDVDCSASEKHMTKTEMLLARRRRTTLTSSQSDDSHGDGEISSARAVTAV